MLLIDEPELLLHPPQASRLGAALARGAERRGRQLIVATHSADFVQGALRVSDSIAVCRITREQGVNHAAILDQSRLRELWAKPLLRSAAAIQGIFHEGVIVCEADSDCRFYEAILRHLESSKDVQGPVDAYFAQGGGKGELATLAGAYRGLRIRVAVIADLDLLRNRAEFEQVLSALGGSLSDLAGSYNSTVSALAGLPPRMSVTELVNEGRIMLSEIEREGSLTTEHRRKLSQLLNASVPWSEAKRQGISRLRGGAYEAAKELIRRCIDFGLFLVPFGQLESWWPGGPANDKTAWFMSAIEELEQRPESFRKRSVFTAEVCQYFGHVIGVEPSAMFD